MPRKKLTQEEYIERCISVHGDKYDLSKVEYRNSYTKVEVICPEHGTFLIEAKGFSKGNGCKQCGNVRKGLRYRNDKQETINKFSEIHGDKFSYPEGLEFNLTKDNITVQCNDCGHTARRTVCSHLKGQGCYACAAKQRGLSSRLSIDEVRVNVNKLYGDTLDIDWSTYEKTISDIKVTCKIHDHTYVTTYERLKENKGCIHCTQDLYNNRPNRYTLEDTISQFKKVHNSKYDYSLIVHPPKIKDIVQVICPTHGVFSIRTVLHKSGHGCPSCSGYYPNNEAFLLKCQEVHGDAFEHSKVIYKGTHENITVKCNSCEHEFDRKAYSHVAGTGCPKCGSKQVSNMEQEVCDYIKSLGVEPETSARGVIDSRLELDCYIPEYNLAIEFNGLYWHSSGNKDTDNIKDKHLIKTELSCNKGIKLLHIFENEWLDTTKQNIWKSVIHNNLGLNNKIYARQCEFKEISFNKAQEFLDNNHLQGSCNSKYNYGLFYKQDLVMVATFSKPRYTDADYELIRLASKKFTTIVGGANKLITNFRRLYIGSIISYANRRWSLGNVYDKLGFKYIKTSKPCYFYYKDNAKLLQHRQKYQKHKLKHLLDTFDESLSESENMYNNKYRRIWDSGNLVYILE